MKVKIKKIDSYWNSDVRKVLMENPIREVMIAEHEKGRTEETGWYLIEVGAKNNGNYSSDSDVSHGSIIRTYRNPDLPDDYRNGPWMWIGKEQTEKIAEVNKDAAFLLKKHEWNVK